VTVADPNLSSSQHYLRMEVDDRPGVLAEVARVMASHEISLHSVIQKRLTACGAEVVFVTHRSPRGRIKEAVVELGGLAVVKAVSSVLRVA
jgi:homoserine dehydrogenase